MTGIKGIILCLLLALSLELRSVSSEPPGETNKVSVHDKPVGSFLQRSTRQSEGQLRLVDGGSVSGGGRLEVFFRSEWGTVCRNGWDANDAQVACKQLGYSNVETTLDTSFGPGSSSQTVWLGNLQCGGHESELRNCPHNGIGFAGCSYTDYVGIVCSNNNPSSTNIAAIVAPIVVVLGIVVVAVIVTVVICICVAKSRGSKRRSTPDNNSYPEPTHQTTTTTTTDVEQTRRTSTNVPMPTVEPSAPNPPPMFNPEMSHSYNYPTNQPINPQAYPPPTFPNTNDLPPPYPAYN